MASLLYAKDATGVAHPFFMLIRLSDGKVWNTSGTPAFETYNAANIANYGIAATETGATGVYTATNPSPTDFSYTPFISAAGASLTVNDVATNVHYDGTTDIQISLTPASIWSDSATYLPGSKGAELLAASLGSDPTAIATAILAELGSGVITYTGPVNPVNGRMILTRGDDYYNDDNRALRYTVPTGGGNPDLTRATVTASWYGQSVNLATNILTTDGTPAFTASVTVSAPGTTNQAIMIELSKTQTTLLEKDRYVVTIVALLADGHRDTFARQTCIVVNP